MVSEQHAIVFIRVHYFLLLLNDASINFIRTLKNFHLLIQFVQPAPIVVEQNLKWQNNLIIGNVYISIYLILGYVTELSLILDNLEHLILIIIPLTLYVSELFAWYTIRLSLLRKGELIYDFENVTKKTYCYKSIKLNLIMRIYYWTSCVFVNVQFLFTGFNPRKIFCFCEKNCIKIFYYFYKFFIRGVHILFRNFKFNYFA